MPSNLSRFQVRVRSILCGLYGDWLAERGNPLAMPMQFLHDGERFDPAAPRAKSPQSTLIVLIHGLMGTEAIWTYPEAPRRNYAADLSDSIDSSCILVRYNSGRPVAENGAQLTDALETLVACWPTPVERIILIGHSMGGLVIRSAAHHAILAHQRWIRRLRECVYLGTPHGGSWLARGARLAANTLNTVPRDYLWVVRETVDRRSAGIRNLERGDIGIEFGADLPLPQKVKHYGIAGAVAKHPRHPATLAFGDGLVHASSTRGGGAADWRWTDHVTLAGIGHVQLAHHPAVGRQLREWLA